MLVDLGRNDLGRVCEPGTVEVLDFMTVERYSHVMHIVSTVVGELREGRTAFDALAATFPAGTLSGAPKVRAMEIIEELEPTRRGLYGGVVGYFDFAGDLDTAIAIRTARDQDEVAYVRPAPASSPTRSPSASSETRNKAAAVLRAIAAAAPLRPRRDAGRAGRERSAGSPGPGRPRGAVALLPPRAWVTVHRTTPSPGRDPAAVGTHCGTASCPRPPWWPWPAASRPSPCARWVASSQACSSCWRGRDRRGGRRRGRSSAERRDRGHPGRQPDARATSRRPRPPSPRSGPGSPSRPLCHWWWPARRDGARAGLERTVQPLRGPRRGECRRRCRPRGRREGGGGRCEGRRRERCRRCAAGTDPVDVWDAVSRGEDPT